MPVYDVIVVGARAAGASTAMLLAREGLSVLLVDRSRYGTDTVSTHALMRAGVLQLTRWGLLGRVIDAGTPPVRLTTFRYAADTVPVLIKPTYGVEALYAPRRTVLDPILVDAAAEAGAEVRYGVTVTGLQRDRRGTVTGITARTRHGNPFTASARVVVGADGMRSTVADAAGAAYERVGRHKASVTYGYWDGLETDGYEWNFRPNAASGVIPTNDGQVLVFASAAPRRIGRGGLGPLTRIVAESTGDLPERLAAAGAPTMMRTFNGRPGHIRRSWGPGWALVGDAGYFKDPIGAHGLTDALRDAELLARAIRGALGDGSDEHLEGYQRTRDALSLPLFEVTDTIAGYRWSDAEIPDILMELNTAMSADLEHLAALPAGYQACA